jgi:trehalose 6-phosphate phosphatase
MSQSLFEALPEISKRIALAPYLLLCVDFDGTLTPIAANPEAVTMPESLKELLASLSGKPATSVAVISGRARADLQARIDVAGLIYAGNHGLEISSPGRLFVEPTAIESSTALRQLAVELQSRLEPIGGVLVEDKGLTLSVHYRQVAPDDAEQVRRIVHAALAGSNHPFQLTTGDKVYEIRPRVYWNKGTAVAWVKDHIAHPEALVVYIGDDVSDEDAFAALPNDITVKVDGSKGDSSAQFEIEGPRDVTKFLAALDRMLPQVEAR